MFWQDSFPLVTFATTVWENDWRSVLLDSDYLRVRQIGNHRFPFAEKLLVINNVKDRDAVRAAAEAQMAEGVLTRFVFSEDLADRVLSFFQLKRSAFRPDEGIHPDWVYYNALGPLTALYVSTFDYLLYLTGDVHLDREVNWIRKAIRRMEKAPRYKVANLVWNRQYDEAHRESYRSEWNFYVANQGFSDQMFLVRKSDFCQPIYGEIRSDSGHFPRGDVWEKRVFSYMKNHHWERITYRHGSYIHKSF